MNISLSTGSTSVRSTSEFCSAIEGSLIFSQKFHIHKWKQPGYFPAFNDWRDNPAVLEPGSLSHLMACLYPLPLAFLLPDLHETEAEPRQWLVCSGLLHLRCLHLDWGVYYRGHRPHLIPRLANIPTTCQALPSSIHHHNISIIIATFSTSNSCCWWLVHLPGKYSKSYSGFPRISQWYLHKV